jgi:ribonucleotide reductase alpha subunit
MQKVKCFRFVVIYRLRASHAIFSLPVVITPSTFLQMPSHAALVECMRRAAVDVFTPIELANEVLPPVELVDMAMYKDTRACIFGVAKQTAAGARFDARWGTLASRLILNWVKDTCGDDWRVCVNNMRSQCDTMGTPTPRITLAVHRMAFFKCGALLQNSMDPSRDYLLTYADACSMYDNVLVREDCTWDPLETPQMAYMRVACALNPEDESKAVDMYHALSKGHIVLPTATLRTLGTTMTPQVMHCVSDSILAETDERVNTCAKNAMSCEGDYTVDFSDTTSDVVTVVERFSHACAMIKHVAPDGADGCSHITVSLGAWHANLEAFLNASRDVRTFGTMSAAVMIPNILMRRAADDNGVWSLMSPHKCPGLADAHGVTFESVYCEHEKQHRYSRQVPARDVLDWILKSQACAVFKDTVNESNLQDLGTVNSACVAGDTELLTEYGPVRIGTLVPDTDVKTDMDLDRERYKLKVAELEKSLPHVMDDEDPATKTTLDTIAGLKKALEDMPTEREPVKVVEPVRVWTGDEWTTTTPALTGTKQKLIRVTTSHGARLDVTQDHKWVLADGSKVSTTGLAIGTKLIYTRPVVYTPPQDKELAISDKDAFFLGAVYGYGLRQQGVNMADTVAVRLQASVLMFRRAGLTNRALRLFDYNKKKAVADKRFAEINHDDIVVVDVPSKYSQMRVCLSASVDMRQLWVAGFTLAIEQNFFFARTCHRMLHPVLSMFRSTGEHLKMIPMGRNLMWMIVPVKFDEGKDVSTDVPVVAGIEDMNVVEDVYCVSSEKGKATFNLQLTGNCESLTARRSDEEVATAPLAAVALDTFVQDKEDEKSLNTLYPYDFTALHEAVCTAVRNLDTTVDTLVNLDYESRKSVTAHRVICLDVTGFAAMLAKLSIPWMSPDDASKANDGAVRVAEWVAETIYHASVQTTCELAKSVGPHPSFMGTQASKKGNHYPFDPQTKSTTYEDWESMSEEVRVEGRRNAAITCSTNISAAYAPDSRCGRLPTESNLDAAEGVNQILVDHLKERGLWTPEMRDKIAANPNGSVKGLGLGKDTENIFAVASEIHPLVVLQLASSWQAYTEQMCYTSVQVATHEEGLRALHEAHKLNIKSVAVRVLAPVAGSP